MLDEMGKRYGKLPSELLINANTVDLTIMDAAISYYNFKNSENPPEVPVEELEKILEKNRGH